MVMTIKRAANFIDRSSGEYFTVSDVAKHCECQIKFLNATFDALCGCNAKTFIQRYRATRLRGAIKSNPGKSIEDLAASCGMPLTPTSKRIFLSLNGISISEFREDCIQRSADNSLVITKQDCANASDMIDEVVTQKRSEASVKSDVRRMADYRSHDNRMVG
jgi:AraC-like DNA-binding protein